VKRTGTWYSGNNERQQKNGTIPEAIFHAFSRTGKLHRHGVPHQEVMINTTGKLVCHQHDQDHPQDGLWLPRHPVLLLEDHGELTQTLWSLEIPKDFALNQKN
jgi:hypothetical protein